MKVEPIHLFSQARLAEFKQTLLARVRPWYDEWVVPALPLSLRINDNTAVSLQCDDMSTLTVDNSSKSLGFDVILEDYSREQASIVWRVTPDMEIAFFQALAGIDLEQGSRSDRPKSEVVSGVIKPAIEGLICRLLDVQLCSVKQNDSEPSARYSSLDYQVLNAYRYFCLSFTINNVVVNIWAPKAITETLSPQYKEDITHDSYLNVVARESALGQQSLTLQLTLGEAELSIGELTGLKIGDVIGLEKPLDEPLSMTRKGADMRLSGYLGARQGKYGFVIESVEPIKK